MESKRVCQVCGSLAKAKEILYAHYGGICCLSCKAFFRRIFRARRNPDEFECKSSQECKLNGSKRTKCKKCRYNKCLQIGMQPHLVPDDEECKKYTYAKKRKKSNLPKLDLGTVLEAFNEAHEELREECQALVAPQLISSHLSSFWNQESLGSLNEAHLMNQKLYKTFAGKSRHFSALDPEDQILLLNNASLFQQYLLAKYFTSNNGFDQLTWLLGLNMPQLALADTMLLQRVSMSQVWADTQQYANVIRKYRRLCCQIGENYHIPQYLNGLLAHYTLFSVSHWPREAEQKLKNPRAINAIATMTEKLIVDNTHGISSISQLIGILDRISKLSSFEFVRIHNMNRLEITLDEQGWIDEKVAAFHHARSQVKLTEEFMQAYCALHMKNIDPESKAGLQSKVIKMSSQTSSARAYCMLKLLYGDLQASHLKLAYLVVSLKNLGKITEEEQLEFIMGKGVCYQSLNSGQVAQMEPSTKEGFNEIHPLERKHEWTLKMRLSQRLVEFLANYDVFVLILFLILTSDNEELQRCFKRFVAKKLHQLSAGNPERLLHDFMCDLQDYSMLSQTILDQL